MYHIRTKGLNIQREELFVLNEIIDLKTRRGVLTHRGFSRNTGDDEGSHDYSVGSHLGGSIELV
jgi:hypothetical protein